MIKAREIEAKMLLVNTEDKFLQRCFGMHILPQGGRDGKEEWVEGEAIRRPHGPLSYCR